MYTIRSAFIQWLKLHNEEWRACGHIRIPNWFRWYVRNNCNWEYHINSNIRNYYEQLISTNDTISTRNKRSFKGFYQFEISDEKLINLKRTE